MTPDLPPGDGLGPQLRFAPEAANRLGDRRPSVIAPYPLIDVRMFRPRASFLPRPDAGRAVEFPLFAMFLLVGFGVALSVLLSVVHW